MDGMIKGYTIEVFEWEVEIPEMEGERAILGES